jgi:hypothetical protein
VAGCVKINKLVVIIRNHPVLRARLTGAPSKYPFFKVEHGVNDGFEQVELIDSHICDYHEIDINHWRTHKVTRYPDTGRFE